MARLFLMNYLLSEAYSLDFFDTEPETNESRSLQLFQQHKEYISKYRLSKELVNIILEDVKSIATTTRRQQMTLLSKIKLLSALCFFADGIDEMIVGTHVSLYMSQPPASRIETWVDALSDPIIVRKYIPFPENYEERLKLKEKFFTKYKIPGVLGCIEGFYVRMIRPSEHEEKYYCREGNHARNVLLITDADQNILHVDASYGGATHDSLIFANSEIKHKLEELVHTSETVHLLGDSAHAQRAYLMVPVPNAKRGSPEENYNKLHAIARNTVEKAIAKLKGRFRCLLVDSALRYRPDMVAKIVVACCVLHNICNRAGLSAPTLERHEQQSEAQFRTAARGPNYSNETVAMESAIGLSSRQGLVNALWRARTIY